ncbi:MAG: glutathione transferase GstA [Gammaproteobacteria bacterium RIFCSPHIGHO2_12_FULL_37_14]|nr:MAG: glutathione transferase GstA [Gammaproteobacteria bacterium RIFCSPHIGHO2_12_FULL_37_14]
MKLYYSKGACSLAVRIVVNELGIACEYESVDLKSKKTETGKNFLDINLKGAVPTIQTDEGEILTENAVIQQYLADKYQSATLLAPVNDFRRYRILEWLNYISVDLHKTVGALFNEKLTQEMKDIIFLPTIKTRINYVEHQLTGQYLMGNDFTLPDAYLYVILNWMIYFKFDLAEWPNVQKYFIRLKARPSIQKSLQEEGMH